VNSERLEAERKRANAVAKALGGMARPEFDDRALSIVGFSIVLPVERAERIAIRLRAARDSK